MTLDAAKRLYRNAVRRLRRRGCTRFALLAHGAGAYSIEYRDSDGSLVVRGLYS
jgi:hypothetical protein